MIAANLEDDGASDALKEGLKRGLVSKDDLASVRRAHRATVDATKSPQREAVEELLQEGRAP